MDDQNAIAEAEPRGQASLSADPADEDVAAAVASLVTAAKAVMAGRGAAESLALWQEIRERYPHLSAGHVGYAEALKELGQLDEAERLLSDSVRTFPDDFWAWVHYAQTATRRSDWTEAMRRWLEIRDRFPAAPAGYVGYAEALKEADRLDEAEGLLSESVTKFPDDMWARVHHAQVAARRGEVMEALRRWQDVRTRFADNPIAIAGYTEALRQVGRLRQRCLDFLRLLKPGRVEGFSKARFGSPHDGGYVMIDDFTGVTAALSFGIAHDANWDSAVADRGFPVYQFDHTVDSSPIVRPDLIFSKTRIAAAPEEGAETIDDLVRRHGNPQGGASLILKIDIEGDEWAVFDAASEETLASFTQIVAELHFLGNIMLSPEWYQNALRVITKLTSLFGVAHVHANNGHGVKTLANVVVPHIIEVTLVNKARYRLSETNETFPGPYDSPNDPELPDISLGQFAY